MSQKKVIGLLGVLFGIAIGAAILLIGIEKLIFNDTDFFLVKYFLLISMINCSLYFLFYGVLQFTGFIVPYYAENKTDIDKARNSVCSVALMTPILISGTATVLLKSDNILWKILWLCFLFYSLLSFLGGVKKIMSR